VLADRVTGLPVVDQGGVLVGIVTEKDMLALLNNPDIGHVTAADLPTRYVVSFGGTMPSPRSTHDLKEKSFRRVPILSDGKFVGIVSRTDIMKTILRERRG
jgi:CBS domain-containing protein